MELRIVAIGRLKNEPEADLVTDYLKRAAKQGRAFGVSRFDCQELDERKATSKDAQAALITSALNDESYYVLDERGRNFTSPEFAQLIARHRDEARGRMNFVIGGADGLSESLRAEAAGAISFGKMVWPHMLARVMLSEQIYRAMTILAGGPYHRS